MEFTEYVREQRPVLLRFATVLTGQAWLADDVVSDVLARAYERWDDIGSLAHPHAYVRRMIVNEHLSWRRRLRRVTPRAEIEPTHEVIEDTGERYAERDAMIERLRALPRKQRAAVVLRYYAELSVRRSPRNSGAVRARCVVRSAGRWPLFASPRNPPRHRLRRRDE